jgi:hypothetical protein
LIKNIKQLTNIPFLLNINTQEIDSLIEVYTCKISSRIHINNHSFHAIPVHGNIKLGNILSPLHFKICHQENLSESELNGLNQGSMHAENIISLAA